MNNEAYLRKVHFRAWHRGTREADMMIGGFFDHCAHEWDTQELQWFETLLNEQDVDIMGWAMGTIEVPINFQGSMMDRLKQLDFITTSCGIEDMT